MQQQLKVTRTKPSIGHIVMTGTGYVRRTRKGYVKWEPRRA